MKNYIANFLVNVIFNIIQNLNNINNVFHFFVNLFFFDGVEILTRLKKLPEKLWHCNFLNCKFCIVKLISI
jgi:hypothetical protein